MNTSICSDGEFYEDETKDKAVSRCIGAGFVPTNPQTKKALAEEFVMLHARKR